MPAVLHNLKICGITSPATARFCAEAGVGALGAIFYRKSPRYVSPAQAREIFDGLPPHVARVGVFVDLTAEEVAAVARDAQLTTVQLHGDEPGEVAQALAQTGLRVIKVLKVAGGVLLESARRFPAHIGLLVECGKGALPGGNGAAWNWSAAAALADLRPFALAGGLTPDNLAAAAAASRAAAWDLSSGVETAPGVKDHAAIARAAAALRDFLSQQPTALERLRFWSNP
jgi:phosphoribosylanthranilate isomerase